MVVASGFTSTVTDGPLLVAAAVAVLVGLIGFLSPCVLPLVPGYLSYVAGLSGEAAKPSQKRMLFGALLFVLGFTAVYVAQGIVFGELGGDIRLHRVAIERVLGTVTIVMGVVFLGFIPALQRERRVHRLPRPGLVGAPLLGLVFGLAWAPCQTPTLSVVNSLAAVQGTATRGAILQVFYCLGLGIPFLLVAVGFAWVSSALSFVRRHRAVISRAGGAVLIVIGILLVSGTWDHWMVELQANFGTTASFEV